MKSLIIVYIPDVPVEKWIQINQSIKNLRRTVITKDFQILAILDSTRKKVETTVFFNPYQK